MLWRIYAQPFEQMVALGCFCAGGVLARHPELRVAFLEANCSWLPALPSGRLTCQEPFRKFSVTS